MMKGKAIKPETGLGQAGRANLSRHILPGERADG